MMKSTKVVIMNNLSTLNGQHYDLSKRVEKLEIRQKVILDCLVNKDRLICINEFKEQQTFKWCGYDVKIVYQQIMIDHDTALQYTNPLSVMLGGPHRLSEHKVIYNIGKDNTIAQGKTYNLSQFTPVYKDYYKFSEFKDIFLKQILPELEKGLV